MRFPRTEAPSRAAQQDAAEQIFAAVREMYDRLG
jgi:hypothetical protein